MLIVREGKKRVRGIVGQARTLLLVARGGETKEIIKEAWRRLYSNGASYILRRDLFEPLKPPIAKLAITVRPVRDSDMSRILKERPRRYSVLRANIPTCYIAESPDGQLCYMQWLIAPAEQMRFRSYFCGELKNLRDDEQLLEFAYTFEKFRGQGVMAAAMAKIAEQNISKGARWALTFVREDNLASLKGCKNAGFRPYMYRTEQWRLFHLKQSFKMLPERSLYPFEAKPAELPAEMKSLTGDVSAIGRATSSESGGQQVLQ